MVVIADQVDPSGPPLRQAYLSRVLGCIALVCFSLSGRTMSMKTVVDKAEAASPDDARIGPEDARITPGALRMRVSRQRRREGFCCLTIEMHDTEIERLIKLGLLEAGDREDQNEVLHAIYRFFDRTLGAAHQ
jgi:hypothetical protein